MLSKLRGIISKTAQIANRDERAILVHKFKKTRVIDTIYVYIDLRPRQL